MNFPLIISRAFRVSAKNNHFIRNFSCKISTNVGMASQRLIWVDLEVSSLRFKAFSFPPFPPQNENFRETKRGGWGSGFHLLYCCYFCQNYDEVFQNHLDHEVGGVNPETGTDTPFFVYYAPVPSPYRDSFLVSVPLKFASEVSKCS